jgi:hypothetical protein
LDLLCDFVDFAFGQASLLPVVKANVASLHFCDEAGEAYQVTPLFRERLQVAALLVVLL